MGIVEPGAKFGRWTVLSFTGKPLKLPCSCDCGTEREVNRYSLAKVGGSFTSRSCGCLAREVTASRARQSRVHHIAVGDRFARWTVIGELQPSHRAMVPCRCDCGVEKLIPASNLYGGRSLSCGCLRVEKSAATGRASRKHGLARTPIYNCWAHMMRRCTDPRADSYRHYGGRGIKIHEPWKILSVFVREVEAEIGPLHQGMTLDRVDNDGNYEPGNIRWATRLAQARNRRNGQLSRRPVEPGDLTAKRRKRRKLTHDQLVELLVLIEGGMSQTAAAERFGISQPHVSSLVREARTTSVQ